MQFFLSATELTHRTILDLKASLNTLQRLKLQIIQSLITLELS